MGLDLEIRSRDEYFEGGPKTTTPTAAITLNYKEESTVEAGTRKQL